MWHWGSDVGEGNWLGDWLIICADGISVCLSKPSPQDPELLQIKLKIRYFSKWWTMKEKVSLQIWWSSVVRQSKRRPMHYLANHDICHLSG
jgi:hypothetical protein